MGDVVDGADGLVAAGVLALSAGAQGDGAAQGGGGGVGGAAEVLVAAHFPVWDGACGFSVEEAARRHGDFAMAGVVCGVQVDGDRVARAALAFLGVDGTPVRATAAEAALVGTATADVDAAELAALAVEGLQPPDDLHASGAQRQRMSRVLAQRAITNAIEEAAGA